MLGVEGPLTPALDPTGLNRFDELLPSAMRCAELLESDPNLVNASPHFLALGRVPAGWP